MDHRLDIATSWPIAFPTISSNHFHPTLTSIHITRLLVNRPITNTLKVRKHLWKAWNTLGPKDPQKIAKTIQKWKEKNDVFFCCKTSRMLNGRKIDYVLHPSAISDFQVQNTVW